MLESKHLFKNKKDIKLPLYGCRLIGLLAISTSYIYIYIIFFFFFITLYLDIMNDSDKSKFYLHLSTSKSVRRLLKIWVTSAL